jgi:rare lipoprotein A
MNQRLWSSLTTAALLLSTLGAATASYANQPGGEDETQSSIVPAQEQSDQIASTLPTGDALEIHLDEVSKVGEYQSQEEESNSDAAAIAVILPHPMNGRQAATLYVNDIPVLTFLGSSEISAESNAETETASASSDNADVKVGSLQTTSTQSPTGSSSTEANVTSNGDASDPVWRASAIAARINQLYQNRIDADTVIVRWSPDRERYQIAVNDEPLVEFDPQTILPDTTGDPAEDALQATNRLRRLLGGASPLNDIQGRPQSHSTQLSFGSVQLQFTGMASWYGPGFHGRRSASGEVFNQNALTAAHRTLPFGTQVRVTNLNTGQSVVVRITDRGPHVRGRVIDLSAGAARTIGLISSGVAPVSLEVLGVTQTASN